MDRIRYEVKRIGVFSAVKTLFLLGGCLGFLTGLLQWAFMGLILSMTSSLPGGISLQGQSPLDEMIGGALGTVSMFLPFFGAFMGAIGGAILGFILSVIYNLSVRFWGGLELEWETVQAMVVVAPRPHTPGEQTPLPVIPAMPQPSPPPEPKPAADTSERRPPSSMYE